MIPLRDSNRPETVPFVTITLIIFNFIIWLYEVSLGRVAEPFIVQYGLIPLRFVLAYRLEGGIWDNAIVPMFASLFMHGGWLHIIGNMWFLWIFGDNVEDRLGHFRYLLFYILCGIGASLFQVIANPGSRVPTVGASGAISGVLGAYLVSFPHARILTLVMIFFFEVPAHFFLIFWFLFQFLSGASEVGVPQDTGGVAYWAHIGGFIIGVILVWIFPKRTRRDHSFVDDRPHVIIYRRW